MSLNLDTYFRTSTYVATCGISELEYTPSLLDKKTIKLLIQNRSKEYEAADTGLVIEQLFSMEDNLGLIKSILE